MKEQSHSEVVDAKWKFWAKLKAAKDLSSECAKYAQSSINLHDKRREATEKEDQAYIRGSGNMQHDPKLLEKAMLQQLQELKVDSIQKIFCADCISKCRHVKGVHVIVHITSVMTDEMYMSTIAFIKTFLQSKHETMCSAVDFCKEADLEQFVNAENPARFHLRDAIEYGEVLPAFSWNNYDTSEDHVNCSERCPACYKADGVDPLSFKLFNTYREWALYIPLVTQILLGSFLNHRQVTAKTVTEMLPKKLKGLYCTYDILLNIWNKNHIGIHQERNTYELIMGYRSVNTVFEITSHSGVTMCLKAAEEKLKARAEKDFCYFNTYIKSHELAYTTDAGPIVNKVSLHECPIRCLLLDNLVRL